MVDWEQTDMYERWGSNGEFGHWQTYWQYFYPSAGMCVEGVAWSDNYGMGSYTKAPPRALNPQPSTRNPKPSTRNPKPKHQTRNPKLETNPKSET